MGLILSIMVFLALLLLVLALLLERATRILIFQADRLLETTFLVLNKAILEIVVQEYRFQSDFFP
jgi:hypothetical protein